MHYIYTITNIISNRRYVGQTSDRERRWKQHQYYATKTNVTQSKAIQYIHRAMAKHGTYMFRFDIIDFANNKWEADCLEKGYIKRYDTRSHINGYNLTPGGDKPPSRLGIRPSIATIAKISAALKGKNTWAKGNTHRRGKIVGKEGRERMSLTHLGKKTGERLSQEQRQQLVEAARKANTGRKRNLTDEQRHKLAEAIRKRATGRKASDETRRKQSAAAKRREAHKRLSSFHQ